MFWQLQQDTHLKRGLVLCIAYCLQSWPLDLPRAVSAATLGVVCRCRSIDQPGGPRAVMWCNHAAEMRLGRPRTEAEVLQWWEHFPEQFKAVSLQVLQSIHQNIIVSACSPALPGQRTSCF